MKKVALVVALFLLVVAASGAAVSKDDNEFKTGLKYYNSKNYKEAVRHFKEYTAKKPDPTAYYLIGYSLYKLGKFSEADDYFREAFFIDPEFSLEKVGLVRTLPDDTIVKEPVAQRQPELPGIKEGELLPKGVSPATTEPTAPAGQKQTGPGPAVPPSPMQKPSAPGQQVAPVPQPTQPAPSFPPMPAPSRELPPGTAPALVGMVAAMGMFMLVVWLAFYIYFCLCMYLIAKKLDVPAPWTAWIPLVQIWTFVASAGKPGWWIVLLFVPLVNLFVGIYLWLCITENLGRNKWLGLLMLVPIVNMVFLGVLAFSKSESPGGYRAGETLPE